MCKLLTRDAIEATEVVNNDLEHQYEEAIGLITVSDQEIADAFEEVEDDRPSCTRCWDHGCYNCR